MPVGRRGSGHLHRAGPDRDDGPGVAPGVVLRRVDVHHAGVVFVGPGVVRASRVERTNLSRSGRRSGRVRALGVDDPDGEVDYGSDSVGITTTVQPGSRVAVSY